MIAPWKRPKAADIVLQNSGAVIRIGGDKAFYPRYPMIFCRI
jgi:antirestriction protein ArdC